MFRFFGGKKAEPASDSQNINNTIHDSTILKSSPPMVAPTAVHNIALVQKTELGPREMIRTSVDLDSEDLRYASFWRRAFAIVLDQIFVISTQLILLLVALLSFLVLHIEYSVILLLAAFACATLVDFWLYTALFEHSSLQATPGKYLLNLMVVNSKGRPLSFWQSSWRIIVQYVLLVLLSIPIGAACGLASQAMARAGYFNPFHSMGFSLTYLLCVCWCLFNKRRQTLFDKAAGRFVVHRPNVLTPSGKLITDAPSFWTLGRQRLTSLFSLIVSDTYHSIFRIPAIIASIALIVMSAGMILAVVQTSNSFLTAEKLFASGCSDSQVRSSLYAAGISSEKRAIEYQVVSSGFAHLIDTTAQLAILKKINVLQGNVVGSKLGAFYFDTLHNYSLAETELLKEAKLVLEHSELKKKSQMLEMSSRAAQNLGQTNRALSLATIALQYQPYNTELAERCNELANLLPHNQNTKRHQLLKAKTDQSSQPSLLYDIDEKDARLSLVQNAEILSTEPKCTAALISSALCYTELKNNKKAEELFARAIASDPEDPFPLYERALSRRFDHDKGALDDVDKALTLSNDLKLVALRAEILTSAEKYDAAIESRKDVIASAPNRANFKEYARTLNSAENYKEAIKYYTLAINAPDDSFLKADFSDSIIPILCDRAESFANAKRFEEALADIKESNSLTPRRRNFKVMAEYSEKLGKDEEALKFYAQALTFVPERSLLERLSKLAQMITPSSKTNDYDPSKLNDLLRQSDDSEDADVHEERGRLLLKLHKPLQAADDFKKSSELSWAAYRSDLAIRSFAQSGYLQQAADLLKSEIEAGKRHAVDKAILSKLYFQLNRNDSAKKLKQQALADANKNVRVAGSSQTYHERFRLFHYLGRYPEALADAKKADLISTQHPVAGSAPNEQPDYYPDCAIALNAVKQFDKALEYCDADQSSYMLLPKAQALYSQKKYQESNKVFDKILKDDDNDIEAMYGRGQTYKKLSMTALSDRDILKAVNSGYASDPMIIKYPY